MVWVFHRPRKERMDTAVLRVRTVAVPLRCLRRLSTPRSQGGVARSSLAGTSKGMFHRKNLRLRRNYISSNHMWWLNLLGNQMPNRWAGAVYDFIRVSDVLVCRAQSCFWRPDQGRIVLGFAKCTLNSPGSSQILYIKRAKALRPGRKYLFSSSYHASWRSYAQFISLMVLFEVIEYEPMKTVTLTRISPR